MNNLLFYIISTGVCLSLFILTYLLFLKNNTRFNLCRFYLIAAILFSFIIPFITVDVGIRFNEIKEAIANQPNIAPSQNFEVQELPTEPIQIEKSTWNINYNRLVSIVFLSISFLLFVRFIFRFGSIILIQTSGNRHENEDGTNLIFTDRTDNAFSFLRSIFINPLKFTDEEKRLIIEHEREHIRHLHSIDLILIELLIVLQWFNPFAYIARRRLIEIHEFIADNGVIRKGADPYSYQNLLLSVVSSSCLPTVGNQLSALITKKRIAMIGKPLNQTGRWINFLILVPITLTLIIGISAFSPKKVLIENEDNTYKKELIARAEKDGVRNAMQDIYFELNPNESKDQLITEFIKGNDYDLYFFTNNEEDKIHYVINDPETKLNEVTLYSAKLTIEANQSKRLSLTVTSESKNKIGVLIRICLKGTHNSTTPNPSILIKNEKQEIVDTFLVVEQMPTFGNGDEYEFHKWIAENRQFPKETLEKGVHGKVIVEFLVSKDGSLKNPKIVKSVNPLIDAEAIRLINSCPKWNPGKQRGKAVDVKIVQPIDFSAYEIEKKVQALDMQNIDEQTFNELKSRANKEIIGIPIADYFINQEPKRFNIYTVTLKQGCEYNFKLYANKNDAKFSAKIFRGKLESQSIKLLDKGVSNNGNFQFTPTETGYYVFELENISSNKTPALMVLTYVGDKNSMSEWGKRDADFPGIFEGLEKADKTYYKEVKKQNTNDDDVFMVVEQMPVFKNGIEGEFESWLNSNIQYPIIAKENGIQGRVFVQFVIEKDGSITNVKIIRGVEPTLDKEALRVVQSSPKWKPGMQRGQNVRVQYTCPISFVLGENNDKKQIQTQVIKNSEDKSLNELSIRAESEAKGTYLKDFIMQIASGAYQSYSVILKKGITYSFYLFSNNKEDQLNTRIDRALSDKSTINEKTIDFSYSSNFTFTPEVTAAYLLTTKNLSSKNANSIIYLTLK